MKLYRPVGLIEMLLIYQNGLMAFPPRLPEQPIFYPVLHVDYARQIAFNWNIKTAPFAGYVTEFSLEDKYSSQFEKQVVGGKIHEEFWVPAQNMDEFNRHIIGKINVIDAKFGSDFQGYIPDHDGLKDKNALQQFLFLVHLYLFNQRDLSFEVRENHTAVFLNYPFWLNCDFTDHEINLELKQKVLKSIQAVWVRSFPEVPFMNS